MQYPASYIKNYFYVFFKQTSSKLNYFINWASTTNYINHFIDVLFVLKSVELFVFIFYSLEVGISNFQIQMMKSNTIEK